MSFTIKNRVNLAGDTSITKYLRSLNYLTASFAKNILMDLIWLIAGTIHLKQYSHLVQMKEISAAANSKLSDHIQLIKTKGV